MSKSDPCRYGSSSSGVWPVHRSGPTILNCSISRCCAFEVATGLDIALVFTSPLIALQKSTDKSAIATTTATCNSVRNVATALSAVLGGVILLQEQQGTLFEVMGTDLADKYA